MPLSVAQMSTSMYGTSGHRTGSRRRISWATNSLDMSWREGGPCGDSRKATLSVPRHIFTAGTATSAIQATVKYARISRSWGWTVPVSYTHLRAHETDSYLVCRLLL